MNPMKGLFQKRAFSRMSEGYINTSWTKRILIALAILGTLAVVLLQTVPQYTVTLLAIATSVLVFIHFVLRYPNIIKVAIVWFANELLTVNVAVLAVTLYSSNNVDQFWGIMTWVLTFTVGSLIVLAWALRLQRGKIWLTLTFAYAAMQIGAVSALMLTTSEVIVASVGTVIAFAVVILRYVFPRRKKWEAKLPEYVTSDEANAFIDNLPEDDRDRFKVIHEDSRPLVLGVSKQGYVYAIELVNVSQPFTVNNGSPVYQGVPMAGWLAESYLNARDALPKGMPFIHVLAPQRVGGKNAFQQIEVTPRNSVSGKPYVTFMTSQSGIIYSLKKITDGRMNAEVATEKQLTKLKEMFV